MQVFSLIDEREDFRQWVNLEKCEGIRIKKDVMYNEKKVKHKFLFWEWESEKTEWLHGYIVVFYFGERKDESKFFATREEAEMWLKQFAKENSSEAFIEKLVEQND